LGLASSKPSIDHQCELPPHQKAVRDPADSTQSSSPNKRPILAQPVNRQAANHENKSVADKQEAGQQIRLEKKQLATTRNPVLALSKGQMFSTRVQGRQQDCQEPEGKKPLKANISLSQAQDSDSSDSEDLSKQSSKQKQIVLKPVQRKLSISQRDGSLTSKANPFVHLPGKADSKTESSSALPFDNQENAVKSQTPASRADLERLLKNSNSKQITQDLSSLHTKSFNVNSLNLPTGLQRNRKEMLRAYSRNGIVGADSRAALSLVQSSASESKEQKKVTIKIEEISSPKSKSMGIDTYLIE
jgi:hypothetical protein